MRNIPIVFLLTLQAIFSAEPKRKEYIEDLASQSLLTSWVRSYVDHLQSGLDPRPPVKSMENSYLREKKASTSLLTPSWVALDIILKYQMPGYDVVPSLPQKKDLWLDVSDDSLEWIVRQLVTPKIMPSILARRPATSLWGSDLAMFM